MRPIVSGGLDFTDREMVFRELDLFQQERGPIDSMVSGGLRGAETLACQWGFAHKVPRIIEHMRKEEFNQVGLLGALSSRAKRMIELYDPDCGIIFPGGRDILEMVRQLDRARIGVFLIPPS